MEQKIFPKKLSGCVTVPPSKSQAHRALICACLAGGASEIKNLAFSDDIRATISAMQVFGATINTTQNSATISGGAPIPPEGGMIDCNESGSTIRFLIPLAWLSGKRVSFTGRSRLFSRPLDPYFRLCDKEGIFYEKTDSAVTFCGKLKGGKYHFPGNISSQFISGLLFALPLLPVDSTLILTTPLESAGYVDMTLDTLSRFGIQVINRDYQSFFIPGGQVYKPCPLTIEGDYSQAAFYLCANAMGSQVQVLGLNESSCQGDREILSIIRQFGSPLKGITIDVSQVPDLVPVLCVLASQAEGTTRIVNARRLRIKESDRLATTAELLSRLGATVEEEPEGLIIHGKARLTGGTVDAHNDHRIAMAAAIAATVAEGPVIITESQCVAKSYGNFWEDYFSLQD